MAGISAAQLVRVWECGQGTDATGKALILLSAAHPEIPAEELRSLSIGRRDASLVRFRRELFGAAARAFAECPRCLSRLEYEAPAAEMLEPDSPDFHEPLTLEWEGWSVRFRLINSGDVAAASACRTIAEARRMLASRCIVEAHGGGAAVSEDIPESVIERISERLGQADPNADLSIALTCLGCGHGWEVVFDVAAFLWAEVSALAKRLMREVDVLARAYHWREADILAMSWVRRQFYMEMAG